MNIPPVVYKNFLGIYNGDNEFGAPGLAKVITRQRGATFLSSAQNVDIDPNGRLEVRQGRSLLSAGNYHSLSRTGSPILAVKNGNLVLITLQPAFSEKTILSGVGTSPMSYESFLGRKYYTNGTIIGYVENEETLSLPQPGERYMRALPAGHLIRKWGNRLLVAVEGIIICSEVAADYYDYRSDSSLINMGGRITMIEPVADGCYISNQEKVLFLKGNDPLDATVIDISTTGAFEGSSVVCGEFTMKVPSKPPASFKTAIMWASKLGIFFAGEGGEFINITENWYTMPSASKAAGVVVRNQPGLPDNYICTIDQ